MIWVLIGFLAFVVFAASYSHWVAFTGAAYSTGASGWVALISLLIMCVSAYFLQDAHP